MHSSPQHYGDSLFSFCSYVEYSAVIKLFHLILPKAGPLASLQLLRTFPSSLSIVLLQVVLGLPLFPAPWGFMSSVCLSVAPCGLRSLWTIQHYFLSFICCSTGVYFNLCHNSSFEIPSSHLMFRIHHRHQLKWVTYLFSYFPCFMPKQ
jgi:hypothetical protein